MPVVVFNLKYDSIDCSFVWFIIRRNLILHNYKKFRGKNKIDDIGKLIYSYNGKR